MSWSSAVVRALTLAGGYLVIYRNIEDEVRAALVCEAMHDLKLAAIAQLGNALSGK